MTGELVVGPTSDDLATSGVPTLQKPFRISELIAILTDAMFGTPATSSPNGSASKPNNPLPPALPLRPSAGTRAASNVIAFRRRPPFSSHLITRIPTCGRLRGMKRRHFLVLSTASVGGLLVYTLDRQVSRLSAQDDKSLKIPLRFFTAEEALIVRPRLRASCPATMQALARMKRRGHLHRPATCRPLGSRRAPLHARALDEKAAAEFG